MKYRAVYICPIFSNGLSTGFAPIQVRMIIIEIRAHRENFLIGLNFVGDFFLAAKSAMIRTDMARAMTPPSLEGIDRSTT